MSCTVTFSHSPPRTDNIPLGRANKHVFRDRIHPLRSSSPSRGTSGDRSGRRAGALTANTPSWSSTMAGARGARTSARKMALCLMKAREMFPRLRSCVLFHTPPVRMIPPLETKSLCCSACCTLHAAVACYGNFSFSTRFQIRSVGLEALDLGKPSYDFVRRGSCQQLVTVAACGFGRSRREPATETCERSVRRRLVRVGRALR